MRCWLGVLTVGFAMLGCSGKYVVGTMDRPDGAGGSYPTGGQGVGAYGGSGFPIAGMGATGTVEVGGSFAVGGSEFYAGGSTGGSMSTGGVPEGARVGVGPSCVGPVAPAFVLEAPVASTEVIWKRMSLLVYGKATAPPANLVPMLNEQDMMGIVDQAFLTLRMENSQSGTLGAGLFIQEWLGLLTPFGDTGGNYQWRMIDDSTDVFPILLESMHVGGGRGVFTEQAWLLQHKSISARGANVMTQLFGLQIPMPPPGSIMDPVPDPNLSDRDRLDMAVAAPVCRSCHTLFDGPGFALNVFDSAGQYRTQDHGQPIDTSGTLRLQLEQRDDVPFKDWDELTQIAENSCDATVSLADSFLRFAMSKSGYDETSIANVPEADRERVEKNFAYGNRSYPSLVKAYLQTSVGHAP